MKINNTQSGYGVPVAIVIAGLLIAGAVFWTGNSEQVASNTAPDDGAGQPGGDFRLPNETDHIRGNPEAPITIVEFSDFECPFCARLHQTLTRIIDEDTDVRWVFRHFPLTSHSRAFGAAVISECIAKLGSNDAFWNFADTVFADQRKLGNSLYEEMALTAGIDISAFNTCLKNKAIAKEVQADLDEVINIGGRGTPYVVVVTPTGKLMPFSGALPYAQVAALIDQARRN